MAKIVYDYTYCYLVTSRHSSFSVGSFVFSISPSIVLLESLSRIFIEMKILRADVSCIINQRIIQQRAMFLKCSLFCKKVYLPDLFKSRQSKDHKVVLIPRLTFVDQSKNEIFKVDIRDQTKGVISGFLSHSSFVSVMCKTLHLLSFGHFVFIFVAISRRPVELSRWTFVMEKRKAQLFPSYVFFVNTYFLIHAPLKLAN